MPTSPMPGIRLRTWGIPAAVTLTGLAALAARDALTPAATIRPQPTPPGATRSTAPARTVNPGAGGLTAQQRLLALADQITTVPADTHTGPNSYVHTQLWARATTTVSRFDQQHWRSHDGTGRVTTHRLPDRADLTRLPDGTDRDGFAAATAQTVNYLAGELPAIVGEPVATDPHALADQIYQTVAPQRLGSISLVTGAADIPTVHYLDKDHRAATLRMLATIPEITYRGETGDIAGRVGLTWSLDSGGSGPHGTATDTLIFDPATGELLAHQRVINITPPQLWAYTLYLDRDRRDHAGG